MATIAPSPPHLNQPPLPNPPHGFNYVEAPSTVVNIRPPIVKDSESSINKTDYFFYCDYHDKVFIEKETLRGFFRNPFHPWPEPMERLLMEGPSGVVAPAHLPSLRDLRRLPQVCRILIDYQMDELEGSGDPFIVPPMWEPFLDPPPILRRSGRIFVLRSAPCNVLNADYADAFDVLTVAIPLSSIQFTLYSKWRNGPSQSLLNVVKTMPTPANRNESPSPLPTNTNIVLWNVRGVNRSSFPSYFAEVLQTHNPYVFILMETRAFEVQFELVYARRLEIVGARSFCWFMQESVGNSGGFIIMWRDDLVQMNPKAHNTNRGRGVTATLKSLHEDN